MAGAETVPGRHAQGNASVRPWFADDPRVQTRSAADRARRVADRIGHREPGPKPNEQELFTALHTCAYRSARSGGTGRGRVWTRRWEALREYIVQENLGLVYAMVSRFHVRETDRDELVSEGMFALTRAVDRYNPFRGFRFSTYACNVIARAMMRRGKVQSRYRKVFVIQSDDTFDQSKSSKRNADLYAERLRQAMDHNLGQLTKLESHVLAKRFPLSAKNPDTFREIGEAIGLSKERVRQIQNTALTKLRRVLKNDPVLQ